MKKIIILTALFAAVLFGCKNRTERTNDADSSADHHNHEGHHHDMDEEAEVSLNNGERWPANVETTEGIEKMTVLVKELPTQPSLDDYHTLKGKLDTEFDQIIKQCTMTGEAHTQLHNYLMPMKRMIENLNSSDIEICKSALDKLNTHLSEYGNYFQ